MFIKYLGKELKRDAKSWKCKTYLLIIIKNSEDLFSLQIPSFLIFMTKVSRKHEKGQLGLLLSQRLETKS